MTLPLLKFSFTFLLTTPLAFYGQLSLFIIYVSMDRNSLLLFSILWISLLYYYLCFCGQEFVIVIQLSVDMKKVQDLITTFQIFIDMPPYFKAVPQNSEKWGRQLTDRCTNRVFGQPYMIHSTLVRKGICNVLCKAFVTSIVTNPSCYSLTAFGPFIIYFILFFILYQILYFIPWLQVIFLIKSNSKRVLNLIGEKNQKEKRQKQNYRRW